MNEIKKEFYSQLGLLSVQFAKMEFKLTMIITGLFGVEEKLVALTAIEKNNLSQNLELLRKLNRIVEFEEDKIELLIKNIDNIRRERNLFIHGIWAIPNKAEGEIEVICEEKKLNYSTKENESGKIIEKHWNYNKHYFFKISDLKKKAETIDQIITEDENLLKLMSNKGMFD